MELIWSLFWTVIVFESISLNTCLQCTDEDGENVDWFVIYKLPKKRHENKHINSGLGYTYITSNDISKWKLSDYGINETESMLVKTLHPFYDNKDDLIYIIYNDQPPHASSNAAKGHSKGVILFEGKSGFWLVHSVPHFPAFGEVFSYPETGTHYGQSMLCISMNLTDLNKVGILLQYNEPQIYGEKIKSETQHYLPDLWKAANNVTVQSSPYYHAEYISSLDGTEFTAFAKTKMFSKDLYTDLVAQALQSSLLVETWPNERDRLRSNCSHMFSVKNVKSVNVEEAKCNFTTTEDHSKWAVSENERDEWICIGDINRAEHQLMRGGGTVCQRNKLLSKNYEKIIDAIEGC